MPGNFGPIAPRLSLAILLGCAVLTSAASTTQADQAPKVAPEETVWKPATIFEKHDKDDEFKDQPRMNLSGAACVPTTPKFRSCLIANDEKRYAQFFSINGATLKPRKLIRLSDEKKDPDAEGVAYADGFFYVIGSHGRGRHSDSDNDSSYAVFRFPVDPSTGLPKFKPNESKLVGVEASSRLRKPLRKGEFIKKFYDEPLAEGGINIEGIAVKSGRMHLGLRGPSIDSQAFILSVDTEAVFDKGRDLKGKVTPLGLGQDTGIRDLAAISDGILILAGPTRDEAVAYSVWLWNGIGTTAKQLAILDLSTVSKGAKAEILLPLDEEGAKIRILVMFDGVENGGAKSFAITR
jgi:hypothetical protein